MFIFVTLVLSFEPLGSIFFHEDSIIYLSFLPVAGVRVCLS